MKSVDIIFPLDLSPLTYDVPDELTDIIRPGMLASAMVKNKMRCGIVKGNPQTLPAKKLRKLNTVFFSAPALSNEMLKLIEWMSGYYYSSEGSVAKSIFPAEFFLQDQLTRKRLTRDAKPKQCPAILQADEKISGFADIIRQAKDYGTYLYHAPDTQSEWVLATEVLKGARNILITAPTHDELEEIFACINNIVPGRTVLYHGGLRKSERLKSISAIANGDKDIVIGSRSAVFAPMNKPELIIVTKEDSELYKAEAGPRYNARDVAVMRGLLEGARVLITSICPSVESYHNCITGKYDLLDGATGVKRPRVRIIRPKHTENAVSETLRKETQKALSAGRRVLLYVNRKGHSVLKCQDCGYIQTCPDCGIPLVYYKSSSSARCGYCGVSKNTHEECPECRGVRSISQSAGVEKLAEELAILKPVTISADTKDSINILSDFDSMLTVGTKAVFSGSARGRFDIVGFVNADSYRYMPDFRSRERVFREIIYASNLTDAKGSLIVQSKWGSSGLAGFVRNFDFKNFYLNELKERLELHYPPFWRLASITYKTIDTKRTHGIRLPKGAHMLGPASTISKSGNRESKLLVKAASSSILRSSVDAIISALGGDEAIVDIDPVRL